MWEKHNQLKKQAQAGVEICLIFKICREKGDFMKMKFTTIFVACFVLFCCVFATGCSSDNNDPKSKEYPYIPNEILSEVDEVLTPEMFGAFGDGITDDSLAVQKCLEQNRDQKSVCVLSKKYVVSSKFASESNVLQGIRAYPNTYIHLSGTLLANPNDGHGICLQFFEYNGDNSNFKNKNITLTGGGCIDGFGQDENTTRYCSMLRMGHGENIKIENITFKNAVRYHCMEISSCKNVVINKCNFLGFFAHNSCEKKTEKNHSVIGPHEFIQIEELDSGGSAGMTPYDQSIPENITISNCQFSSDGGEFYKAIGDHGKRKYSYKNINIVKNTFKSSTKNVGYDEKTNSSNNCIVGFYTSVDGLVISQNVFQNCNANAICASGNVEIKDNIFNGILFGGVSVLFNSHITIDGNTFVNVATQNAVTQQNYFSYIKFGNSESRINVNATICNNTFQNDSQINVKILELFEYSKSTYIYSNNVEIGNFDRQSIENYTSE